MLQKGELAHRTVKMLYGLTNKRSVGKQIGNRVRRRERARLAREARVRQVRLRGVVRSIPDVEDDCELRYYISPSKNKAHDLFKLTKAKRGDPAFEVSNPWTEI
jgi:hypothetical protein